MRTKMAHCRTIHIAIVILSFASFASSALVNLPPPEEKFKILMLLPFASKSHRNCFLPLAESLAERGHEIVILSPLPPTNKHPNIEEINHGIDVVGNVSMFHVRETDPSGGFQFFEIILPVLAREMYDVPEVKKLYESRSQFDMFIIDGMFNEPAYPFLVNENFISISTAGVMPDTSATLGNFLNPAYVPSLFGDFPRPYSFVNRALNLFFHIVFPLYWRTYSIFPIVEKELLKKFPNLPPLGEIEKGMVLEIANGHYTLHESKPLLPSQIEAGGMHCQKAKTLPKDLKNFIEGSGEKGVIYFSLGSVCESKTMPEKFKKVLLGAFQKIKYRVIWKFEEEFPNLPSNIMVQKWLPQQDILGHPKVKLFITHGGLLSMQESIYHSKPLLALPIFGDQLKNAQNILKRGYGTYLVWEDLTEDLIISTISELIDNPKYMTEVVKVSKKFRDQHVPPLERAVWWTEYVIRNKDDLPTKSPAADLSWIEYLMIDVILALHALVFAIYFICKKIIKGVIAACSSSRSQSSSKKKKE